MASSAPFTSVTAFTSKPFGGNPAAIIFLDLNTSIDTLQGLSCNFNQPMAVFVKPPGPLRPGETIIRTDIRYVTATGIEVPICGHGSLAAAKAILALPTVIGHGITEIRFNAVMKGVIVTIKVDEGGLLEMELPTGTLEPVPVEEQQRISGVVNRAFGREVKVNHIAAGGKGFEHVLMIEIDEGENLAESKVNGVVFGETGWGINSVTSASSSKTGEKFVSRMFSKEVPGGEDHVCGTAHCLFVPYWYVKQGIERGSRVSTRQVSPRGGLLEVVWTTDKATIKLKGEASIVSTGICYF